MRILQIKSRVILFKATMVVFFRISYQTIHFGVDFQGSSLPHSHIQGCARHKSCHNMQLSKPSNLWMPNKCSQGESIFGNIAFPTCLRLIDFNPYNNKIHHTHHLCDDPPFLQWQHLRLCDLSCPCKTMKIRTHKAHAYPQVSEYPKVIQKATPIFSTWVEGLDYPMSWLFLFHELTQRNIQYHSLEAKGCQSG